MTFNDFSKEVRRIRLQNKGKWWGTSATVSGRHVTIRAFGHVIATGQYQVDAVDWTPGYGDESIRHFNQSLAAPFQGETK